jgi:TetR/AcrR family transcriptional repressor of mexCD-oprJ operon
MRSRRDHRIWSKEEAVLDAATRLLAVDPRASMQEIAAAAGVSRTTLHRLYPSREALIEALTLLAFHEINAAYAESHLEEGSVPEALQRLVAALFPVVHQFAFLISEAQAQQSEGIRASDRSLQESTEQLFRRGQSEGSIRADLPTAWLPYALSGYFLAAEEAVRQGDIAPREATRLVLESFLEGVAPRRREAPDSLVPITSERTHL